MRPVQRGASPQDLDYDDYRRALPLLIGRFGPYCSYCERRINTQLAVEHIQPKATHQHPDLIGRWDNFLLACINCNSTKSDKDVALAGIFLPDRDNTFAAFIYPMDGTVLPNMLSAKQQVIAARTLALTGLEKRMSEVHDENGHRIAIDRVSQRLQAWGKAQAASDLLHRTPDNEELRVSVAMLAEAAGFFSIWMTVFANDSDMCKRLIEAFPGTSESGCFDPTTTVPISPAPNPDGLPHGGKI